MTPHDVKSRLAALPASAPAVAGDGLTPAAVLVPLVMRGDAITAIFTERTAHLTDHAGQVSFPGGRAEPGDADAEATALRETQEEIGLAPSHIEIIGRLGVYDTSTGFVVTPVVGLVTPPFSLTLDSFEVAEVFEVPLGFLLDPANRRRASRMHRGRRRGYYVYDDYDGHTIWGITAGMVVKLGEALAQ